MSRVFVLLGTAAAAAAHVVRPRGFVDVGGAVVRGGDVARRRAAGRS